MTPRALLLSVALSLAAPVTSADTIHLTDGKVIENVQVVSDGLKEVAYKEGRGDKTVASDSVLAIAYEKRPAPLDEAEAALLQEDPESAIDTLDAFVQGALDKPQSVREFKWAPAQAAWRAVQVRYGAGDLEGAKGAAARVIKDFAESRFVPQAYLTKAAAEFELSQSEAAQKTLEELVGLVSAQALSKRWELEARLARSQVDPKAKPAAKRAEYEKVMAEAGAFPTIKALTRVRLAESFLAEAASNSAGAKDLRTKAQEAFAAALAEGAASPSVIASAHAGLGECHFLLGADADDKAQLQAAVLEFLRVITLHRDQGLVVAKSFFYAMRCFDLLGDPRRKAEMKRELGALYPTSTWAAEAKKY
jgi:hypothetical protein